MFRKSIFIMLFVCLLVSSNYVLAFNWAPNTTWHGGQGEENNSWFYAANWFVSETDPNAVPDINYQALIEPKGPQPRIDGDATCGYLNIMPWSWPYATGVEGEFGVEMNSGTFDCNYGITIGAWGVYENMPDTTVGTPTFTVRGGTVTQSHTAVNAPDGVLIGGGDSGFRNARGRLYMYGGTFTANRIELRNGQINLYGGTLQCDGDGNFIVYQNKPQNKIDIEGGTLRWIGNHVTELTTLYNNGRIVAMHGGTVGVPVFNSGYTTLTGTDANFNLAWNPVPANNAVNVLYRANDVNTGVLLTWNRGDPNVIQHDIYFGTNANLVNSVFGDANYKGSLYDANMGDPCSWLIPDACNFKLSGNYYWRVDEKAEWLIDDVNKTTVTTKGQVWKFTTQNGKAYNPKPINTATALSEPLQLSWTTGALAAGHQVYFGTDNSSVLNANTTTAKVYRGTQTGTTYPLASLSPDYTLVPGTTYYWKVTEVNGTTTWGGGLSNSVIWTFTPAAYVNVDDFEDYNTTADMSANWLTNYTNSCGGTYDLNDTPGGISLMADASGKYMRFNYMNSEMSRHQYYSETRRPYVGGTNLLGGSTLVPPPAALRIDYQGMGTNGVDPFYDRMYVALEDTAGNVAIYPNPDPGAAQNPTWTSLFLSLNDIKDMGTPNPVSLAAVSGFCIGFGDRANCINSVSEQSPGDGNVMFDNIRLYAQTCNPGFAHTTGGLTADFDNDCYVDINDLDTFANSWLFAADSFTYSPITAPAAPVLWYKFDGTGSTTTVTDYSGNGYEGTIANFATVNWSATGDRNGGPCFNIPIINPNGTTSTSTYIEADPNAVDFMNDEAHSVANRGGGITFSVWINASLGGDILWQWPGVFGIWDFNNTGEVLEVPCPSRIGPSGTGFVQGQVGFFPHHTGAVTVGGYTNMLNYGGRWNNWTFVKAASNQYGSHGSIKIYCNGQVIAQKDANGIAGDPNADLDGRLFTLPIGDIHIGTRGHNWAMWSGKMDDFKIYDYALSEAEIRYLAVDATGPVTSGSRVFPLPIPENIKSTGVPATESINLGDLAVMSQQWHKLVLWP